MRQPVSLLLLSLLFLTMACKKEASGPSPLGRWQPESSTALYYSVEGTLTHRVETPPEDFGYYIILTEDSLLYRYKSTNTHFGALKLTRQSPTVFTASFGTYTVQEVTEHRLVLHLDFTRRPGYGYWREEDTYTR